MTADPVSRRAQPGFLFDLDGTLVDSSINTFWRGERRSKRSASSSLCGAFIAG